MLFTHLLMVAPRRLSVLSGGLRSQELAPFQLHGHVELKLPHFCGQFTAFESSHI